jgi:hypothetical protein
MRSYLTAEAGDGAGDRNGIAANIASGLRQVAR